MTVINFPAVEKTDPRRVIWICNCGCTTFYLHPENDAECAGCGEFITDPDVSGWKNVDEPPVPDEPERPETVRVLVDWNDPSINMKRILDQAVFGTSAVVIVIQQDGNYHTWAARDVEANWLAERIERASLLLRGEPLPPLPVQAGDDDEPDLFSSVVVPDAQH